MMLQSNGSWMIISQEYSPNITRESFWSASDIYKRRHPARCCDWREQMRQRRCKRKSGETTECQICQKKQTESARVTSILGYLEGIRPVRHQLMVCKLRGPQGHRVRAEEVGWGCSRRHGFCRTHRKGDRCNYVWSWTRWGKSGPEYADGFNARHVSGDLGEGSLEGIRALFEVS